MSARWISENQLKGHAAICGKLAAQIYNMEVLAEGIETNKRNFTRFLAIADRWTADEMLKGEDKTKRRSFSLSPTQPAASPKFSPSFPSTT